MIVLILMFLIMGIFFFFGKGSRLIAGYNTASKEEKEKYNEKKLCRAMSVFCFATAILTSYLTYFTYKVQIGIQTEDSLIPVVVIFIIGISICVITIMIYTNKYCKK